MPKLFFFLDTGIFISQNGALSNFIRSWKSGLKIQLLMTFYVILSKKIKKWLFSIKTTSKSISFSSFWLLLSEYSFWLQLWILTMTARSFLLLNIWQYFKFFRFPFDNTLTGNNNFNLSKLICFGAFSRKQKLYYFENIETKTAFLLSKTKNFIIIQITIEIVVKQ